MSKKRDRASESPGIGVMYQFNHGAKQSTSFHTSTSYMGKINYQKNSTDRLKKQNFPEIENVGDFIFENFL